MTLTQTDNLDAVLSQLQARKSQLEQIASLDAEIKVLENRTMTGCRSRRVVRTIVSVVSEVHDISRSVIMSDARPSEITIPRQIVFYLAREIEGLPYHRIADAFGRDHGTVMHGHRKIRDLVDTDKSFAKLVCRIREKCEERLKV